ncbi:MAG: G5 domain-containing protein [Clostridia bacterium]|nr:G5 domain-containing protein [Clostridia bacterium]
MEKKSNEKIIVVLTILLFLSLLFFCVNMFDVLKQKTIQASALEKIVEETPQILINQNPVNIDDEIEKNRNIDLREEMIYEEQDLEYTTQYIDNEELPSGTIHVSQIGITGMQDTITIKKYSGDELVSEQIVASNVKKAPINKVVEIGVGRRKKPI